MRPTPLKRRSQIAMRPKFYILIWLLKSNFPKKVKVFNGDVTSQADRHYVDYLTRTRLKSQKWGSVQDSTHSCWSLTTFTLLPYQPASDENWSAHHTTPTQY